MKIHIIVALALFWSSPAHANTIAAASCSQTDVQNAVNSASTGDTVQVPGPCTAAWSSQVSIPNTKGITVIGGIGGTTILTNIGFSLSQNASSSSRISGFTFTSPGDGNGGARAIITSGSSTSAPFRIDHNTFTNAAQSVFVATQGNAPGVIDHNVFTGGAASEMIHNLAVGAAGWTDNVTPGGPQMLFVEDNTFTFNASGNPAYYWGSSALQAYYGARTVFRHNILNMCQVDQHGTAGNIGARWWEIYENTFNVILNGNQSDYVHLRAGSGVVFNNHKTGATNLGAGNIELVEEDTGYPALYQIGRGINQNLSPAYVWGNDSSMTVVGTSSNVVQGRDFFVSTTQPATLVRWELSTDSSSTTYSYVPYPYPHPLQNASSVAAPTSVAAVID